MEQQKEYYAFISYKREDEKWAKWLQNKLEHYKFPTNLNGRTDLPKNIRPTFRDVTDLNPGLLAEEINNALRNSEWLIVVCSPRSAKSPWVCKEAQTFIDLGRADHIIPFVIEGNPFSNDTVTECYPEALLNLTGSKELLAANINEMGRDAAAIKVVARMFNLRFDALWQRYEREQGRKRWMWIGGSVLFALLGLGIGAYFVKQNRTIESQNVQLGNAANRLREDSLTLANHVSKIQADSILLSIQKDSIVKTNILLEKTNTSLTQANEELKRANYQIIQERNGMLSAQSRAVAEKAKELIAEGDVMRGASLAIRVLPKSSTHQNRPFSIEAESALRAAYDSIQYGFGPYAQLKGHNGQFLSCAYSKDGNYILTTSNDGTARIWDVITGREINEERKSFGQSVTEGYFVSSEGDIIIRRYDGALFSWKLQSNMQPKEMKMSGRSLLMNERNQYLAAYNDTNDRYEIWKRDGTSLLRILPPRVYNMDFSPSGDVLAYVKDDSLFISDIRAREKESNYFIHKTSKFDMHHVKYSPNGKTVMTYSKDSIILWDGGYYNKLSSAHPFYVGYASFSPDGEFILACSSDSGKVKILRIPDLKPIDNSIINHEVGVESVDISPTKNNFIERTTGYVSLYKNNIDNSSTFLNHSIITPFKEDNLYCGDNRTIARAIGEDIVFYNVLTLNSRKYSSPSIGRFTTKKGDEYLYNGISQARVSSQGLIAYKYKSGRKTIHLFNQETGFEIDSINMNIEVDCLTFSPNGKLLAIGCRDRKIYIWDMDKRSVVAISVGHKLPITALDFDKEGKTLVSASHDYTIRFWNVSSGQEIVIYRKQLLSKTNDLSFDMTGDFYLYTDKKGIHVNNRIGKEVYMIRNPYVKFAFFSGTNNICYCYGDDYSSQFSGYCINMVDYPTYGYIHQYFCNLLKGYELSAEERRKYYLE